MSKYSELISILRHSLDKSKDDFKIVSEQLSDKLSVLDELNVVYESQAEGISIDLSAQAIKIFKTKISAVRYVSHADFSSDIIIIEPNSVSDSLDEQELVFEVRAMPQSRGYFFDNLQFFHKFKKLLLEKEIASYCDEALNRLIFLSSKHGRLHVAFNNHYEKDFYDTDNELKVLHHSIDSKIAVQKEFSDFFRESFIEYAKLISDESDRYIKSLENMRYIFDSACRNYELFKHNFSFSDFKKQFNEDKEKYFKDYQSNLSDFLSKISSMPVQFGVYIYLIFNFKANIFPLCITTFLILSWSIFSILSVNQIINNVIFLNSRFHDHFKRLVKKSGLSEGDIADEKREINSQFDKSLFLMRAYRIFVIVFSLCALVFCTYFIDLLLLPSNG